MVKSEKVPENAIEIRGHDFSKSQDVDEVMKAMLSSGFQASQLGKAINEINRMVIKYNIKNNS